MFVLFGILGVAADEDVTGEIYSLSFGCWISKCLCIIIVLWQVLVLCLIETWSLYVQFDFSSSTWLQNQIRFIVYKHSAKLLSEDMYFPIQQSYPEFNPND